MLRTGSSLLSGAACAIRGFGLALAVLASARCVSAQDTPLLSGGVGFFTATNAGNTTYTPVIEPLIAAPLGPRLLVESRSMLQESFAPNGGGQPGYGHSHFIGVIYMQGDFVVSPHFTLVTGYYLIPFNTYNDRLSPIWIGNFQDGPTIATLGSLSAGSGLGGMLSRNAISRNKYSIDYNWFYSARSGNAQFDSSRGFGGRTSLERRPPGRTSRCRLSSTNPRNRRQWRWWAA
jgi:hypothetical protein